MIADHLDSSQGGALVVGIVHHEYEDFHQKYEERILRNTISYEDFTTKYEERTLGMVEALMQRMQKRIRMIRAGIPHALP